MSFLILLRHGQSTWNAANKFTGWVDVPLSKLGLTEAAQAAEKLKHYSIDLCFTSLLIRSIQTALVCLVESDAVAAGKSPILKHNAADPEWHGWDAYEGDPGCEIPVFLSQALDERYYGRLQGLNKTETAKQYGVDQVTIWRRSYSVRPPGGESLADTSNRTLPFFKSRILPHVISGDRVLVSAHGNSLRSIIMDLENLSEAEVPGLELATSVPIVYEINAEGQILAKTILTDKML
jgi:2,3-bisphosphoglycerate-dependent phosphoglycerate mutase